MTDQPPDHAVEAEAPDFPVRAAGVDPAGALAPALALRADILAMTGRSRRSVLAPSVPGGLSPAFRLGIAVRIARQNGDVALADGYGALGTVDHDAADPARAAEDAWRASVLRHADLLTLRPRDATEADIAALDAAGVATADIVRLSQLVAFVNYEARLVAGLRLLAAQSWRNE